MSGGADIPGGGAALSRLAVPPSGFARDVEVDGAVFEPPPGLRAVALRCRTSGDGGLAPEVADVAIAFGLAGVAVWIDVPAELEALDLRRLFDEAVCLEVGLMLVPPRPGADAAVCARHLDRCAELASLYLSAPNCRKGASPVSDVLQDMMAQALNPGAAPLPLYPEDLFGDVDPLHEAKIRRTVGRAIAAQFGGDEGFRQFAMAMAWKIRERAEAECRALEQMAAAGRAA